MRATLTGLPDADLAGVRSFEPHDTEAVGELMYRAYFGTVDYEGETPGEAAAEVRKVVQDGYGPFLPACSQVAVRGGRVVSATLVTRYEGRPFVAFTFTDPGFAGQGLARACMLAAMARLAALGETELGLVVSAANAPALALYGKLGFRRQD